MRERPLHERRQAVTLGPRDGGVHELSLSAAAVWVHLRRHVDPILAPGLLTAARFRAGATGILTYYIGFAAILLGSTLLLTDVWHYSSLETALAIAPGPLVSSVIAPFAGRIMARFGFSVVVGSGAAVFALAGLWPLLTVGDAPAYGTTVLPSLVLWGVANGLIQPGLFSTASAAPTADLSSASAVLTASRQLGSAVGVAVLVAVLTTGGTLDVAGVRRGWLIVTASAVATVLVGLWKRDPETGVATAVVVDGGRAAR